MWTEKQKRMHRTGIGGGDIGDIMGVGFGTPYKVWLEKLDLVEDEVNNESVEWGARHEDTIAKKFVEAHPSFKTSFPNETFRHPEHEWCLATPDGETRVSETAGDSGDPLYLWLKARGLLSTDGTLEIKTSSEWVREKWGEEETDDIPESYIYQVHQYMFVRNTKWAVVAVLIGGNKYREYFIERNEDLIEKMFEAGRKFWFDCVLAEVEPPVTAEDGDALAKRYPKATEELMESTPEIDAKAIEIRDASREIKVAEKRVELLKNEVKALVKAHEGVVGPWGKMTWKAQRGTVDYKALALGKGVTKAELEKHRRADNRPLRPFWAKEDKED